ncbi:MAG: hypothetical protein D6816_17415 [Bacteroidetes bacterium]|nr:MAG: hypothetical protein D6816_17415 [Bacteroidota bacterium]
MVALIYFFTSLIGVIIFTLSKAYYHYEYLKIVQPHKTERGNYFRLFTRLNYRPDLQFLLFPPYVKRYKNLEDEEAERMYRKVRRLTIIEAVFWVAYLMPFLLSFFN